MVSGNRVRIQLLALFLSLLVLAGCQARSPVADTTPLVCDKPGTVSRGRVETTTRGYAYEFHLYLPPCYERDNERRYPVVYLIPGRGGGPGDWFAAAAPLTADDLILTGQVPPFIMVSTESTDADPYADAIIQDLIPHIESHYRVQADRHHRAVAGASLGGIGAYRLAFRYPEQFGSAALFGSGLISGEEEQVRTWLAAIPAADRPRVFLNCGEEDSLMLDRAQVIIALLDEFAVDTTTIFSPGEHTYSYWVANLPAYFLWLAEEW